MRQEGFYWIFYGGKLQVAQWFVSDNDNGYWYTTGSHWAKTDKELDIINEQRIPEPKIDNNETK